MFHLRIFWASLNICCDPTEKLRNKIIVIYYIVLSKTTKNWITIPRSESGDTLSRGHCLQKVGHTLVIWLWFWKVSIAFHGIRSGLGSLFIMWKLWCHYFSFLWVIIPCFDYLTALYNTTFIASYLTYKGNKNLLIYLYRVTCLINEKIHFTIDNFKASYHKYVL